MHENPLVKILTCLIPDNQPTNEFISTIPEDTEILTLLEESAGKNNTIHFSYLEHLTNLIGLEISGLKLMVQNVEINSSLSCMIDTPLNSLKYLILNNIELKPNNRKILLPDNNNETLETQTEEEILPYDVYISKEQESKIISFKGFDNLLSLRISSCNLQNIHWKMFEGMKKLLHLSLEDNYLKFIPDFAFYGTPNLVSLSLANNNLLNIEIADLAGLLELEYLFLSKNNFSQLSELSFPPFPKLKLANFQDNPITIIYPNTFDVMNTTDSLIVGCHEIALELLPNSFTGLNKLVKLTIINVSIPVLKRDIFNGMPKLKELTITGNITEIEFDTFSDMKYLEKLTLSKSNLKTLSMDSFFGLKNLDTLDLSDNQLATLSPGIFDHLTNLKELYLQKNSFENLPENIFKNVRSLKLIRLNENPWFCSCSMSKWDPKQTNKIKKYVYLPCDSRHDKGVGCIHQKVTKYEYENRVAPKCKAPFKYRTLGIYQVLRKFLQCNSRRVNMIQRFYKTEKKQIVTYVKYDKIDNKFKKPHQIDTNNDLQQIPNTKVEHNQPFIDQIFNKVINNNIDIITKKQKYNQKVLNKLKKMKELKSEM